jgi:hypothetical protein
VAGVPGARSSLTLAVSCVESPGGDGSSPSPTSSPTPSPEDTAAEEALAEAQALQAECEAALGGLLDTLHEIDSRLGVGIQVEDYTQRVGDARVEYDQVPFRQTDQDCVLEVGVPAEDAINLYIQAGNIWNNCIQNFGCSLDEVEPKMQRKWSQATRELREADQALRALGHP